MTVTPPVSTDRDRTLLRLESVDGEVSPDGREPAPLSVGRARPESDEETWWEHWRLAIAAAACWALLVVAFAVDHLTAAPHAVVLALYVGAYLAGGTFATRTAITDLIHGHVNVDLLMVTAAIGAACVDAWAEGAVLLGLFSTSNALEHHALGRTRRAVRALMELSPEVATLVRPDLPGGEAIVPVEELGLGDVVLVRPGERVAVDGVVIGGETACDQSAITGESLPVEKRIGDNVFAGTINTTGAIQVRVTKLAQESTLAKIIAFVEEAREQKSRTQRFTDAFEGKYAIGVITVSALVAVVPWLFFDVRFEDSFYRAMTLLVVASPCALVISTPASTLSGLANAARHGILFKGGGHLEDAGLVRIVAFDKTGTLTQGRTRLTDAVVLDPAWSEPELLRYAASAERLSEHHLSQAIVAAALERGLALVEPEEFRALPGQGILAVVAGREIAIGNEALFAGLGVAIAGAREIAEELRAAGKSAVYAGDRGGIRGVLAVADTIRPSAAGVVADLKRLGIERSVMLTGDNRRVAEAIAEQVGIAEVEADLLPEEKLGTIRRLMSDGPVVMVGDGINDAPALATATLGVAMGGAGTDVALETADVVLMADDLTKLPYAIALSRRTRRTIVQNLAFSLSVIAVLVTSALTIGIPLPLGVVGHEGSTIIVVLNGLRLLR
ncbi:MAG TPA: heavy metal translocating P-type ATPase [Thermomicrobiales bacterium]|nr:heavy metal translocating P-type ATPase [Thermomicrobiales bacterium]